VTLESRNQATSDATVFNDKPSDRITLEPWGFNDKKKRYWGIN